MVLEHNIQRVQVFPHELQICKWHAHQFPLRGERDFPQEFRREGNEETLWRQNMVGQIGTLAFHKWFTGGNHSYMLSRWIANQTPYQSDGGSDFPVLNVDVKTSLYHPHLPPLNHHLAIRPSCEQTGWVYVLALMEYPVGMDQVVSVDLIGWAETEMFPEHPRRKGVFRGAKVLQGKYLNPFPAFRWLWWQVGTR